MIIMNPSEHIDQQISSLTDWRGQRLAKLRSLIHEADPDIKEDWKWETAVFSDNGMVCATGAFKDYVKLNFFNGASIQDPNKLLNAGLQSKAHRAIDIYERDSIDEAAVRGLIRIAVEYRKN